MNKWINYLLAGLCVLGLIAVRRWETTLFYDPFLAYFKGDFYKGSFPSYELWKLIGSLFFRYVLNSAISLLIIWFLFQNKRYIKFSIILFAAFFFVLLPMYLYFIHLEFKIGENIGFYVRRFLIQPYLLLILIPAYFYHEQKMKMRN